MPHFIPRSDDQFLAWSANYVRRISADPARFDISDADASRLTLLQADFAEKLFLAKSNATRSAIAAKNSARSAIERVARRIANKARATMMNLRVGTIETGLYIGDSRSTPRSKIAA